MGFNPALRRAARCLLTRSALVTIPVLHEMRRHPKNLDHYMSHRVHWEVMRHPESVVRAILERLRDAAVYEHPGYFLIDLKTDGEQLCFGTADGTWGSDVIDPSGQAVANYSSTVPTDCTDVEQV